jgi:hypothetical protein
VLAYKKLYVKHLCCLRRASVVCGEEREAQENSVLSHFLLYTQRTTAEHNNTQKKQLASRCCCACTLLVMFFSPRRPPTTKNGVSTASSLLFFHEREAWWGRGWREDPRRLANPVSFRYLLSTVVAVVYKTMKPFLFYEARKRERGCKYILSRLVASDLD